MAAITQHRPHDALAGRRFGAFSGKTESAGSSHPVGRITQHRPHCGIGGRRFGSFAGKSGSGGTEWDLVAPLELPALAGTLTLAGDLTYSAGETELAQSGTLALSGTLTLAGDLAYSDAPIAPPPPIGTGAGGGMPNNTHRATILALEAEEAEALRIKREDEMVLDCITALVAAGVL